MLRGAAGQFRPRPAAAAHRDSLPFLAILQGPATPQQPARRVGGGVLGVSPTLRDGLQCSRTAAPLRDPTAPAAPAARTATGVKVTY